MGAAFSLNFISKCPHKEGFHDYRCCGENFGSFQGNKWCYYHGYKRCQESLLPCPDCPKEDVAFFDLAFSLLIPEPLTVHGFEQVTQVTVTSSKVFFPGGAGPAISVSKEVTSVVETPVAISRPAPDEFEFGNGVGFHLMFIPNKTSHSEEDDDVMIASYTCRCCEKRVAIFHPNDYCKAIKLSSIWSICYFCYLNEVADISSKLNSPDDSFSLDAQYGRYYVDANYLSGKLY